MTIQQPITTSSTVSLRQNIFLKLIFRNQLATFGLVTLSLLLFLALITPLLPLADPDVTVLSKRLTPVFTEGYWLGTDQLGRDLLSRILWGTRVSLAVGISATLISGFLGSLIGLLAGYFGGRVDGALMRGIDMVMAFPYILLALAIVAALGPGLMNALLAIAIVNIPFFARNVRGVVLTLRAREFIAAARLSGKNHPEILFTEVLPNVMPVIVITMSTTVGWMILETAGLSFLGLGAQPPQADLGSILGEGRRLIINAPHVATIPGIVIFILVMSINLLGDGIRDALDPRLKAGALARPGARTKVLGSDDKIPVNSDKSVHRDSLLNVVNLHTEFQIGRQTYKAVNDVSLSVQHGECLGVIGESGSGKSVTAMSVMGLVASPPGVITHGAVNFQQENLIQVSNERLRQLRGGDLTYIFQDPLSTLHPLLTIGDQLVEVIRAHRRVSYQEALQSATKLLKSVRIPNASARVKSYPHQLSGGMRQRVSIAMAIANQPKLIIADEPTTALDVTVQAQILKLLNSLRSEQGASLVFITHDFGVIAEICDRVAVMYAGELVETGPVYEVLKQPAHPYTRRLIECVPDLTRKSGNLVEIPGLPPKVNDLPDGCKFADRCDQAQASCRQQPVAMQTLSTTRQARCLFIQEMV